jgi:Protein of unknown function (DUF3551)
MTAWFDANSLQYILAVSELECPLRCYNFVEYVVRETFMRRIYLALAGFAAIFMAGTASADPYKWCANYSMRGGSNCGFVTLEQCRATVSGIGGFCSANQFYTGPEEKPRKRLRG